MTDRVDFPTNLRPSAVSSVRVRREKWDLIPSWEDLSSTPFIPPSPSWCFGLPVLQGEERGRGCEESTVQFEICLAIEKPTSTA